ncbi:MAG: acyclic terpene utilization AtuA family protein [Granulosicoccaceae bacterium]
MTTRVLVPSGVLGLGFSERALAQAMQLKPDIICIDGGSTDSGPAYLGTGTTKYSRAVCKAEWKLLMRARHALGIPLVISSCGTCGTDSMVDWMFALTREIATELGQHPKVVSLYTEQILSQVQNAFKTQRIQILEPEVPLSENIIKQCSHIVALAGREQITAALNCGADIVLAGRATDTAALCALPIANGEHEAAAWHGAKIAECGAFCSTNPSSGVVMLSVDQQGFTIQAIADDAFCTPHSVSAHMLYENANPHQLVEPGGTLDASNATYTAIDRHTVRVEGSRWETAKQYTVKLEGARSRGFQTTILALIRDPHYVKNVHLWADKLRAFLVDQLQTRLDIAPDQYSLEFRIIGSNATFGALETKTEGATEVGVLGIVTSSTQALSDDIMRFANPFVLHYPLTVDEPMPSFAFPYSPAETSRGETFEFCLNHVMRIDDPMQVFKLTQEVL